MAIGDDFSVDTYGNIRHTGGTTNYTVLELHRWLQDLADNPATASNDLVDITAATPSERSTDNIITLLGNYNIDDTAAQYLYDGSVTQSGGGVQYSGLVVVGAVNQTTVLQVVQNNVLYDGDTPFWASGINTDPANNVLSRMLIKTRESGADIDGKKIRVFARELGDTYAEFSVTMGLGNSVAAIFTGEDLNNATAAATIAGWSSITNLAEGYQGIDLNNGAGTRYYYAQWDKGSQSLNDLYERTKWLTRRGTAQTVYGMDGELFRGITHQFDFDGSDGSPGFTQNEILSWGTGTTAGTGALLACDNLTGTTGTMWIQLLTGVPPTDPMVITGLSSGETCDINGSVTSRTLPTHILGVSTGASIIGAYGVGIDPNDLTNADKLFDLTNTLQQPPNNVTFYVTGLSGTEDYVLVGPKAAGNDFAFDQLTLATTLNGGSETAVVVGASIPSDTPVSGYIRVELDTGVYRRVPYQSWTGSTFTIANEDFLDPNDATSGNNVMISYIDQITLSGLDQLSFTGVYNTDRSLFVRVRDGGATPIKTFETPATLGSAGGSVAAIRTSDE